QQRLWFLDQLEPESAFYNIPSAVRLSGELNKVALAQSLTEIVRRHEALRTVFARADGEPVQVIRGAEQFTLEQLDLSALTAAEREARARELAAAEAQEPFDLSRGPLLRVKLLQLAAQEHVVLLTMHHIISDGWSIGVLIRELTALYEAYRCGEESPLEELPIQYADYAVWQREWLQGEVLDGQMEYWRKQLAGASPTLELPMDRMRPAMQSYRGAAQTILLPVELSNSLKELSRRQGATLFMTLLAALETLLYRYSGQEDFCVGSPIANRNRADIEGLIGFFVNTLVLRADLSGNPTFIELLHKVRNVALEAYAHQDVPFEQLVEELQPERALSHSPLFQVMFFIQNTPMSALELSGMTLQPVQAQSESVKFDLALIMQETNSGLVGRIEYSTDLFDDSTITRFVDHFRNLLQGIVADPQQSLMALPLLTTAERELLETEWNDVKEYKHALVHELFELQAVEDPHAVALSMEGREIAYGELNAISNQITHGLLEMGIEPGQNIPVLVEDGVLQVEALLAILKAGAVFVCLDPTYPPARIKQILDELDAPCLISESSVLRQRGEFLQQFAQDTDFKLIGLDVTATESENFKAGAIVSGAEWLESKPSHNAKVDLSPTAPVYIVFTSGSTGKPKGIVQSHQSFCQFLTWQSETFEIVAPKRIAQWASTIYDASYCEIFGTLCFGATLCLTTPLVRHDPFAVINWINDEKISLLQVVPSFCRQMLQVLESSATGTANPFPTLERMLLAGEVLPTDVARDWWARFQGAVKLYNLYGPSETVLATSYSVAEIPESQASIPVGRAIDGRQILILDEQKKLCPIGVKGEIHVRSQYLTLGYFKRSDETQRSFIQNPLQSDYPDPVYCTGDIGRWLVDGNVEFCGRSDNQVKIRGMRVELEEIESALLRFPLVEECVVTAHDYGDGDKRLVAYLKPDTQSAQMEEDSNSAWENQHVAQYENIYDEIYGQTQHYADYDPGLNLRIWVNSYTGQPFRKDEIVEGVEDTVQRIMSLQPRDVLDLGCGSGLLLFRIAPGCRSYLGTDISQKAVEHLDHELSVKTPKISGVTLRHQAAHDFTGIEPNAFD
ncbi:MAG TPA: amino acid adenylation domain-containing protein, partial [Pyrinomonadaceae bacterium]|nr:amino acid adenylation domain-containing protein [Pyrinomonadaceae bacterium]